MGWYCVNCGEARDLSDFTIPCACGAHAIGTSRRLEVIVIDSALIPAVDDVVASYLDEMANETGAVIIATPGGTISTLTRDEAREALAAIIEAEDAP